MICYEYAGLCAASCRLLDSMVFRETHFMYSQQHCFRCSGLVLRLLLAEFTFVLVAGVVNFDIEVYISR